MFVIDIDYESIHHPPACRIISLHGYCVEAVTPFTHLDD